MPKRRRKNPPPIEAAVRPTGRVNQDFETLKRALLMQCMFLLIWEETLKQQPILTQSTPQSTETEQPSMGEENIRETEVSRDSDIIKIESDEESDKETILYLE